MTKRCRPVRSERTSPSVGPEHSSDTFVLKFADLASDDATWHQPIRSPFGNPFQRLVAAGACDQGASRFMIPHIGGQPGRLRLG